MSRAESHDVGGDSKELGSGQLDVGDGEGASASHENAGGESLIRFSFKVMIQV